MRSSRDSAAGDETLEEEEVSQASRPLSPQELADLAAEPATVDRSSRESANEQPAPPSN